MAVQRSASVLMPTYQAREFLDQVLAALAAQRTTLAWDVHVIDSGSTDGTLERLEAVAATFPVPFHVESIPSAEFDHGDTRNQLAARSDGALLVFLTQDAIPSNADWLETLARNFADPAVGAAYSRNVHRSDALPLTRVFTAGDPGYAPERAEVRLPPPEVYAALSSDEQRRLWNFNDVASAIRRDLWERHPFPRTMMGEDLLMARALLEAGYTIVYDADATVDHSHDYEAPKMRWRGEVDARFNAEWLGRIAVRSAQEVATLTERLVARDAAALGASGLLPAERAALEARARELRRAYVDGLLEGSRAPRRYPRSAARARPDLRVLLAVPRLPARDGSLPHALARAFECAHELQSRGSRVTVLALDRAAEDGPSFSTRATVEHGLRVVRAEFAHDRAAVRGIGHLVADERPDVVHVFGLDTLVRPLQEVAWKRGLPFLVTLDDLEALRGADDELRHALEVADLVFTPSVAFQRAVLASAPAGRFDPRRIVPVARGVDDDASLARLPSTRDPLGRVRFGFLADDAHACGLATLLSALRELPPERVLLRIHFARATGAPPPEDVARLLDHPSIEIVRGFAPRDLPELVAEVDVVVVPQESVERPWVAVEIARLHQKPVVASIGCGAEERVRAEVDGLHVSPGDPGQLARTLLRFVDEPDLARQLRPDPRRVFTLRREARELEFRYRAAACLERGSPPWTLALDVPGRTGAPFGPARPQGSDLLMLDPGAAATFALERIPAGPIDIEVEQIALPDEPGIVLAGHVEIDGRPIGDLGRFGPVEREERFTSRVRAWLHSGARELRIESQRRHARLARVRIRAFGAHAPETPVDHDGSRADALRQLRIAESLRVHPGAPIARKDLPSIAVVIPTLDGRETLEACLASLDAALLGIPSASIVVVDNGSSDGTSEHLARTRPGVRLVALGRNMGFAAACNAGARAAGDARVLVFLNNDMRVDEHFVVELVSPIARGECAASTAKRLSWDGASLDGAGVGSTFTGIAIQPGFGAPVGPEHEVPRRTLFPCGGAMAIDAAAFEGAAGFDEEFFAYYEDLDLGWRLWLLGHETHYVPAAVSYHHHSHTSRRFPPEAVRLLVVRNSLIVVVKNYDDANLARVLPAVLALAVRRANLHARIDERRLRIERATPPDLAASSSSAVAGAAIAVEALGAADFLGMDDLLANWDHWMEKRARVQSRRTRPDAEILPMFLEPLACVEGDPAYQALQRELVDRFGVWSLFPNEE